MLGLRRPCLKPKPLAAQDDSCSYSYHTITFAQETEPLGRPPEPYLTGGKKGESRQSTQSGHRQPQLLTTLPQIKHMLAKYTGSEERSHKHRPRAPTARHRSRSIYLKTSTHFSAKP